MVQRKINIALGNVALVSGNGRPGVTRIIGGKRIFNFAGIPRHECQGIFSPIFQAATPEFGYRKYMLLFLVNVPEVVFRNQDAFRPRYLPIGSRFDNHGTKAMIVHVLGRIG